MNGQVLFEALERYPVGATVFSSDTETWNAVRVQAEIATATERLAGVRVLAILADNSPDWAVADLAALRSGVAVLPLPTFFTESQLAHALEQTRANTVLTDQPQRILAATPGFHIVATQRGLYWMRRDIDAAELPVGTAKISFTSGSTGAPKGVCLSAEGLIDTAQALNSRLGPLGITRHLSVLPLSLLLENSAGIYAPLLCGAQVHLPPLAAVGWRGMAGFAPDDLQRLVEAQRPDSLILVPELLKAWTLYLATRGEPAPAGLKFVAVGGSRVEHAALLKARQLGIPAYQGYGLTECGSVVSLNTPGDDDAGVGRPLPHVHVHLRNSRDEGGGEIEVVSRAFLGYLGDTPIEAGRPYATGDLGSIADNGHLHLSGRRKNLLITSYGRNVSPEWVESALLAQPEIMQAVVAGDGHATLCAILVPLPGVALDVMKDAVARANSGLPDYARIGKWITAAPFTLQNGLATGNGRPLRPSIIERYAAELAALYSDEENPHAFL